MAKKKHSRAGIYWCAKQEKWIIDKVWRGRRVRFNACTDDRDEAEALLEVEMLKLRDAVLKGEWPHPSECA